jgi:hypothetical protein
LTISIVLVGTVLAVGVVLVGGVVRAVAVLILCHFVNDACWGIAD